MTIRGLNPHRWLLVGVAALALAAPVAMAQRVGEIEVTQAQALPSVPGARNGGGFLTITNRGKTDDRIVSAASPACGHVELHTMRMEGNVMRMHEVSEIVLPAGKTVRMRPGMGEHLMLMDLKAPLKVGDRVPVTIQLGSGAQLAVSLEVEPRDRIVGDGAMPAKPMHHGMH
jgi:copper(I)-binding protein